MLKRFYGYLEYHNILYPLQFGFRQKCSTHHALLQIAESIGTSVGNNGFSCGVCPLRTTFMYQWSLIRFSLTREFILAPLLILLYINGLPSNGSKLHSFQVIASASWAIDSEAMKARAKSN